MGWRIDIEPDNVRQLGGKARIARALEGPQPVWLQFVGPPDALHRTHRDTSGTSHCPAGPMGRLVRRLGAGQRHHPRRRFRRDRRLAGLPGLVAQQTLNPHLGKALLPTPHRRPADADALRHLLRRVPIRRSQNDARPLDVLARSVTVGRNRCQLRALGSAYNHTYWLCHGPHPLKPWPQRMATLTAMVNLMNDSQH